MLCTVGIDVDHHARALMPLLGAMPSPRAEFAIGQHFATTAMTLRSDVQTDDRSLYLLPYERSCCVLFAAIFWVSVPLPRGSPRP